MFIKDYFDILESKAPLYLSKAMIDNGAYDNSGLLINVHNEVKKVLFTLDLSKASIKRAKSLGVDTIVTHHPAIYAPIKTVDETGDTELIALAVKNGLNVISMHLNLDIADGGIDQELGEVLGNGKYKTIEKITGENGYGREFTVNCKFSEFRKQARQKLSTKRDVCYGSRNAFIKKGASFCGGGSSSALGAIKSGLTDADLIVTSDMPHHIITALVESGKCIMLVPHYSAENYGFKKYYDWASAQVKDVTTYFFTDKRFM